MSGLLDRRREQMEEFWRKNGPEARALVDSTEREIRAALTPKQSRIFDGLQARRRSHHGGIGHHSGGPPCPPDSGAAQRR
ncbi:MAG: hypothetical protein H0V09_00360 [Gemmatimonadetes bacterium]|nr:hypothetical protein [Gemmatimonadota bacterium]